MESFFIKAAQLLLCLSILVIVHEFGHFLFAKLFKIRVEKFYLFFDPWFSLFKFKPKNSDTEYGIGWLPLGGYVKISGMIDESMDKEQMAQPPKPWEFRTKPTWQRLLVMAGGVLFNFILAIIIFSMMMFTWGDAYIPHKNMSRGMEFSDIVKKAGFQDYDRLVNADGEELIMRGGVLDMNTLMQFIDAKTVTVERNGKLIDINPPENFADEIIASKIAPYEPSAYAVVDSILDGKEAQKIGLKRGDSITSINNVPVRTFKQLRIELDKHKKKDIPITFYRDTVEHTVTAAIDSTGAIGFAIFPLKGYKAEKKEFGFFESFPTGVTMGIQTLKAYIAQMRFVFSKEGLSNLGGFGTIGSLFPDTWDWHYFWTMAAFLSLVLAFMNILPIPALDGGHIMFLLYEAITRRKPNEKFMEYAQITGMFLLLALLIVANGNDLIRLIFGK